MLRSPDNPTRVLLRSFWLVWSGVLGTLTASVFAWRGDLPAAAVGFLLGAVVALPGWRWPRLAAGPYAAWVRLTDFVARATRVWITGICFGILAITGRAGSRFPWRPPTEDASGWQLRTPGNPSTGSRALHPGSRGWARRLAKWGWRTGNVWVWALLPFLLILSDVQGGPRGSMGANVYTLY